jgi:hypothetical protein
MAVQGSPAHALNVTPSDTQNLPVPSTWLSFIDATGGSPTGTIVIDTVGGEKQVSITLVAGIYPICATKVYATGTTAQNIVQYWDT